MVTKQNNKLKLKEFLHQLFQNVDISKLGFIPRWIIFCIDVFILLIAALATYYLVKQLTLNFHQLIAVHYRVALIIVVNALFFVIFKTYSGIIRHSTFTDGIKLLKATFCSFVSLLIINYSCYFLLGSKVYLIPSLMINFILNFSFLFLFRIFIKFVFENYFTKNNKHNLIPAMVLGSDANAIAVANALKLEVPSRFDIKGFISRVDHGNSKTLLDLPLIQLSKSPKVILRSFNAKALIIADNNIPIDEKTEIVDNCLEAGYKIFTMPIISDWENKKEISRKVKRIEIEDLLERKSILLEKKIIETELKNKCILITGAAGSIGSEIVRQLLVFQPKKLVLLDQAETPLHNLCIEIEGLKKDIAIEIEIHDVRDYEGMKKIFEKYNPNSVYHAAAYKHVPLMEKHPIQAVLVNVLGTKNMADLSYQYKVEKFVLVSTDKAVNPSNVMGASKRIAEKYIQSLHLAQTEILTKNTTRFITTRFGNVLGSNGSVVPLFTKQIQEGGPVTITHPDIIRYFMTIPESCQLVLEAGAMGNGGEIYIFDMGKPVRIYDLALKMIRMAGFEPEKEIKIEITGLRPGEKLYEELLNDPKNTLPTHHEKITIAHEPMVDFNSIPKQVEELIRIAKNNSNVAIVKFMKLIIPEFISKNSEYETLDNNDQN